MESSHVLRLALISQSVCSRSWGSGSESMQAVTILAARLWSLGEISIGTSYFYIGVESKVSVLGRP